MGTSWALGMTKFTDWKAVRFFFLQFSLSLRVIFRILLQFVRLHFDLLCVLWSSASFPSCLFEKLSVLLISSCRYCFYIFILYAKQISRKIIWFNSFVRFMVYFIICPQKRYFKWNNHDWNLICLITEKAFEFTPGTFW